MTSKMTQIQSMISSLIINVRKSGFHSSLANALRLYKNLKLFVAKRCVILILLYIIYNHYQPETHGIHNIAAAPAGDRLISVICTSH